MIVFALLLSFLALSPPPAAAQAAPATGALFVDGGPLAGFTILSITNTGISDGSYIIEFRDLSGSVLATVIDTVPAGSTLIFGTEAAPGVSKVAGTAGKMGSVFITGDQTFLPWGAVTFKGTAAWVPMRWGP